MPSIRRLGIGIRMAGGAALAGLLCALLAAPDAWALALRDAQDAQQPPPAGAPAAAGAEPSAKLAVDYFVYQAAKQVGALAAVLGGVDALVFTAGIGEHSAEIRRRICEASAWLGVTLDPAANAGHGPRISIATSRVSAWVVPTNEELMIARHTRHVLHA